MIGLIEFVSNIFLCEQYFSCGNKVSIPLKVSSTHRRWKKSIHLREW